MTRHSSVTSRLSSRRMTASGLAHQARPRNICEVTSGDGFSLIELAIVLVILGLLVGGIMTGQSLIRAAELRSVTSDLSRYESAVYAFRDKYSDLPGDMTNATAFWGKDNTNCATDTGTAAASGTCNGNGDGVLQDGTAANATSEQFQFWRQLASAGLIEGSYSGIAGPGSVLTANAGINSPTSKMGGSTWSVRSLPGVFSGDLFAFSYKYGNFLVFGGERPTEWPARPNLKPEEAWNIDTKQDDGLPVNGKIIGANWSSCTTAATNSDISARYNLTNSSLTCILNFPEAF
jgi:prepilin-type N-terminal cleavage/methylation domain-containing protein